LPRRKSKMSQSEAGSGNQNQQVQQAQGQAQIELPQIKVLGFNVTDLVKQYLPQIQQFIDSRIEAKFKEFLPQVQEAVKIAMDNYVKDLAQRFGIQIPSQAQSPSSNPSPSQTSADFNTFLMLTKAFGFGSSTLEDLKKLAEVRTLAEAIVGRGPSVSDVVKAFLAGQTYTLRMLYLMTRGKWEKVEEQLFGSVEKLFGEGSEGK